MGPKPLAEWTVAEVVAFARKLGLADSVSAALEENLVNGEMLADQMTYDDLKEEIGLKSLQIRRLRL